ncbi:MAG: cache domain-containing protein, partial [Planctomycetes bacterium]|nr:cache domain-containing protein [Planctomycetota bacterium]
MSIRKTILIPMLVLSAISAVAVLVSSIVLYERDLDNTTHDRINATAAFVEHSINSFKSSSYLAAIAVADNQGLMKAITGNNREELFAAARNLQNRVGVDFCTILDKEGTVLIRVHDPGNFGDSLASQSNVQAALAGQIKTVIEPGSSVRLSVRTGAPIYDDQGTIVGVASLGFRLDDNKFAYLVKEIIGCEVTVFLGNERIATTIVQDDGTHAIGTRAASNISEKILAGEPYFGMALVLDREVVTKYTPLFGENGQVVGMTAIGEYTTGDVNKKISFITFEALITLIILAVCVILALCSVGAIERQLKKMLDTLHERDLLLLDEKNKIKNMEMIFAFLTNILDGLDEMIYVTDPPTGKILFMNGLMKRHYGITGDCFGQLCYEVLQEGLNGKCDFCPVHKLEHEPDQTIVWEEHNTVTRRFYRKTDRFIDWPGGKTAHLQHSVDITDLKNITGTLEKQVKQQALMTLISQSFLSGDDLDALLVNALRAVGEFMWVTQIRLFRRMDDGRDFSCINAWTSPGRDDPPSRICDKMTFSDAFFALLNKREGSRPACLSSDDPLLREVLAPHHAQFQNYLITPIFLDDEPYAFLDYVRETGTAWTQSEMGMAVFFANILTGAFQKHLVNKQLLEAKEAAERNSRYKSEFLARMSHEIRTPLNAILGLAEPQLHNQELAPETVKTFNLIYDSGHLLLNIVNDVLDLSKIEADRLELTPVKYDLPSLINDAVQLNYLRYENKPVEFNVLVDSNAPLYLFGDELRINQILNNILSNAFKYT